LTSNFIIVYYICKFAFTQVFQMKDSLPLELIQLKEDIRRNLISIDFISKKTGVDQSQISRILNGKSRRLSENYNKICKFALMNCRLPDQSLKNAINEKIQNIFLANDPITLNSIYRILKNLE